MKPIIGICADYSYGISELYGGFGVNFNWQLITDDYVKAIENAGGIPIILPLVDAKENADEILSMVDGIVFAGGYDIEPKHYNEYTGFKVGSICPERDSQELHLAKHVIYRSKMPSIGICRGCQLLNVAGGGTLYQDLGDMPNKENLNHFMGGSPKYNPVHKATIKENSKFYNIFNKETIEVNSYHHQAIKDVAENFDVSTVSVDGVVETIEMKGDRFVLGIQWHPEMMAEKCEEQRLIFKAFINAAIEFKKIK